MERVEEIFVGSGDAAVGSGSSGMTDLFTRSTPALYMDRSGADIRDFNLTEDSVGRLYAYRYTNTSVVLGTRSAEIDTGRGLYMAVGLSDSANGEYVCFAENFPERELRGISTYTVTIEAQKLPPVPPASYLRFSTSISLSDIQDQLYLASVDFVFAMFQTMIQTALQPLIGVQVDISCTDRGSTDTLGQERIECQARLIDPADSSRASMSAAYGELSTQLMPFVVADSSAFSDDGFCNRENEKTDHGRYTWSETQVGETDKQICVNGPKDEYDPDGRASRYCKGHLDWMTYSGAECVSDATARLRQLEMVYTMPYVLILYQS
jgi:hypothetical protein